MRETIHYWMKLLAASLRIVRCYSNEVRFGNIIACARRALNEAIEEVDAADA